MELRIDHQKEIAYIRLTGPLNKEIILSAFDAAVSDESYGPGMGRLWDFRDADLSAMESSTIADMAKYSMRFPLGIRDVKVAFVASRELEFGLSRMFEAYSIDSSAQVAVFDAMDDAEAWLSE